MELDNKNCPNCSCPMVEESSSDEGNFNCLREDGVCDAVSVEKYICTECGHIEESPKASQNLKK